MALLGKLLVGLALTMVFLLNYWRWCADRARVARLKKSVEPVRLKATPRVTLLVAAWNEEEQIVNHLESIRALRYANKEYVLCAGGADGTFDLANRETTAWMTILQQFPGDGRHAALRRCLARATGDILFFTDADCLLTNDAFERTLAPLINQGESAATGGYEPLPWERDIPFVMQRWFTDMYVFARKSDYVSGLVGSNAAVTRDALRSAGDLKEALGSGTDYVVAKRLLAAGIPIRFVRESRVPTRYSHRLSDYTERQTRWLRNVITQGWRMKAYKDCFSCALTPVAGTLMIGGGCLAAFQGGLLSAAWLILYLHVLLSRIRYMRFGELMSGRVFGAYARLPFTALIDFGVWIAAGIGCFSSGPLRWRAHGCAHAGRDAHRKAAGAGEK